MVKSKKNPIRILSTLKIVIIFSCFLIFKNNITAKNLNSQFYFNVPDTLINVKSDTTINFSGFIKNESNRTLNLKIIRTLNSIPIGWSSSICADFLCLLETVDTLLCSVALNDSLQLGVLVNVRGVGLGSVRLNISDTLDPANNIFVNISAEFLENLENHGQSFIEKRTYLNQNYPNPFNSETLIKYNLPYTSDVDIIIFDIVGRNIRSVSNKGQEHGSYVFHWDGLDRYLSPVNSGIYIILIKSAYFQEMRKMTLAK